MENGFSYVAQLASNMQGGDGRYATQIFKESNVDELELKTKKVTDKFSESLNIIANEPSLAFFRIQEHVRKSLPKLVEQKHEVQDLQQKVQGACFDTEYATNAVKAMHKSEVHFQNIQDLLKNAMFMKQQIDYESNRREQEKMRPSMYTATGEAVIGNRLSVAEPSSDYQNSGPAPVTPSSINPANTSIQTE